MTITEFQEDLRDGMTIHDALVKHGLTFKEAVTTLHGYCNYNKTRFKDGKRTLPMYINQRGNGFELKRKTGKKAVYYGVYKSLDDAVRMKAHMQEHGWYKNRLERYRRELGIDSEELEE